MPFSHTILLLFIFVFAPVINSTSILFYFGFSGHSHLSTLRSLILALATRGHSVTIIAPFQPQTSQVHANVTVIVPESLRDYYATNGESRDLLISRLNRNHHQIWNSIFRFGLESCSLVLNAEETKKILHPSKKFDLIVVTMESMTGIGIAAVKQSPFIFYMITTFSTFFYDLFGIPWESSGISDQLFAHDQPPTLFNRLLSFTVTTVAAYRKETELLAPLDVLFRERFPGRALPSISDFGKQASIVLLNSHPTVDYARSIPPIFVNVGGMHLNTDLIHAQRYTQELENFLAKADFGFIYVSFGTAVRISKAGKELKTKFFGAMRESKFSFVWKWEGEKPGPDEGLPLNVYLDKWLPQEKLLADKRIQGAILHAGINGIIEAVHAGVPLILFPFFADQDFNANSVRQKNYGIVLEIGDFTQLELQNALNEITGNSKYKENILGASTQLRDRPMSALDTAIWWTEWTIRHKNTSYLTPPSIHQSWIQVRLLDIWAFVLSAFALIIFVSVKTCIWLVTTGKNIFRRKSELKTLKIN